MKLTVLKPSAPFEIGTLYSDESEKFGMPILVEPGV